MKITHPWPNELVESVNQLYREFASYKADPSSIGTCPACIDQEDLDALFAKPLRELDTTTIDVFAPDAVSTHGSVTDYKHFLPRILELFPNALCEYGSPEIYLSKLRFSEWLAWPEKEMLAVRSFLMAWWRWTLAYYPTVTPARDAISAIAQAEDVLLPYLDEWESRCGNTWTALRQLVDFYHFDLVLHGRQDRLALGPFWEDRPKQDAQVCRWLLSDSTREHIQRAKHEYATSWGLENEIDNVLVHQDIWRNKSPA